MSLGYERKNNPLFDPELKHPRSNRGFHEKRQFDLWIRGRSIESLAAEEDVPPEEIRRRFKNFIKELREVRLKWKRAEIRCDALAMELRLLRLGKEAPPDRLLESLEPPQPWLDVYKHVAGITTVNQLRAVSTEFLLARDHFPRGAIDWAVMKLDRAGLSHRLKRPNWKPSPGSMRAAIGRFR